MEMAVQPAESAFAAGEEDLRFGNLDIYPSELQVFADGRRVGFTVKEFETFMVLATRPDRVVRRAEIYERVERPDARCMCEEQKHGRCKMVGAPWPPILVVVAMGVLGGLSVAWG